MKVFRLLLFPFSILYGLVIWIRNRLFDLQILKSKSYPITTIVVGNLAVGGTGKSPMTEFIVKLLQNKRQIATLSRGYGRKTKGFKYVEVSSMADEVGDEPLQFKNKFPDLTVAVCEDRCHGVETLMDKHDVIVLDDAFQHRRLRPKFSILLFEFTSCLHPMFVLPMGNFRDLPGESSRANLIVVTKTSSNATPDQKERIKKTLSKKSGTTSVFFTSIVYGNAIPITKQSIQISSNTAVLLITGIANPLPLIKYLKPLVKDVEHLSYSDHYAFKLSDILIFKQRFEEMANDNKIIITTEKDAQRLRNPEFLNVLRDLPIAYIPIEIDFEDEQKQLSFEKNILSICDISVNES
ncbi:tetraacyldisaccharide 4'-kinase [Sphingobacterium faecium]|uniref:tetraacyldisaccharide 4'-kinase n=1 Tax=Sphingobacterium faecium TaxID=34087 RepID=UPI003DA51130